MILLQTQAYETHGGMQTYMRRIAEIMSQACEDAGTEFASVSVTDTEFRPSMHPNPCHYDGFMAAGGNRAKFVAGAIRLCRGRRHRVAVLGHVSLASVADLMKRVGLIDHYVVVLHGIEAWVCVSQTLRTACRRAAGIVATTQYTAKEFQLQNLFAHRCMHVVPLALSEHSLPVPMDIPKRDRLSVLTVGRLADTERYKGFDHLIVAAGQLIRDGRRVELKIVGVGNDRERLQALARNATPPGVVQFLGSLEEKELERAYQETDIFAMPSKKEGFGIVFLEAMRYGKPCIGGNHGGTPEVLRDGVDGYLVEFGDEERLAGVLGKMASDGLLVRRLGQNAFERASTEYVYPVMRERWRKILDELPARAH